MGRKVKLNEEVFTKIKSTTDFIELNKGKPRIFFIKFSRNPRSFDNKSTYRLLTGLNGAAPVKTCEFRFSSIRTVPVLTSRS